MAFDPQRYAMDYHVIGFQECVSEVARYLITHEGMDIQNPMRMRLLSHLRCFAAQRELSAKASVNPTSNQNWSSPAAAATVPHASTYPLAQSGYGTSPLVASPTILTPRSIPTTLTSSVPSTITSSVPSSSATSTSSAMYSGSYTSSPHMSNYPYVPNLIPTASSDIFNESNTSTSTAIAIPTNELSLQNQYVQHQDQNGSTYTDLSTQRNALVSIGYSNQYPTNSMSSYGVNPSEIDPLSGAYNSNNKPYRPWGGEMAY